MVPEDNQQSSLSANKRGILGWWPFVPPEADQQSGFLHRLFRLTLPRRTSLLHRPGGFLDRPVVQDLDQLRKRLGQLRKRLGLKASPYFVVQVSRSVIRHRIRQMCFILLIMAAASILHDAAWPLLIPLGLLLGDFLLVLYRQHRGFYGYNEQEFLEAVGYVIQERRSNRGPGSFVRTFPSGAAEPVTDLLGEPEPVPGA